MTGLPPAKRRRAALGALCVLVCFVATSLAHPLAVEERRASEFDDAVLSFAFSPDGRLLAIGRGSPDYVKRSGQIEIRDTETGALLRVIKGFDGPVWSVSFSPDGHTLVSGSSEVRETKLQASRRDLKLFAELKWWDPETGELVHKRTVEAENPQAFTVACSPDGSQLASAEFSTATNSIATQAYGGVFASTVTRLMTGKLLDARTGEVRSDLKKRLVGYQRGGGRGVFNRHVTSINSPSRLPLFQYSTMGAIFSADGRHVAAGTIEEVRLWDARTGDETRTLKNFKGFLRTVAFSPDGRTLATASVLYSRRKSKNFETISMDSEIRLYDVETGKLTRSVAGRGDEITALAFTPDSQVLVIGSVGHAPDGDFGILRRMDLGTGSIVSRRSAAMPVYSLVPSPNGRWLAVRNGVFSVALVDTQSWKVVHTFEDRTGTNTEKVVNRFLLSVGRVPALAFLPDGTGIAGAIEGAVRLWDPRTGEARTPLEGHEGAVATVTVSHDGRTIASGGEDGTVRLWDVETGAQSRMVAPKAGPIASLAFVRGAMLAVAAGDAVTIWDLETGALARTLAGHKGKVNCVAVTADGTTIASAGEDGSVRIWNAETGAPLTVLGGAERAIAAVAFAPDGLTLAAAGDAGPINLWTMRTWELRRKLRKHVGRVNALAFSPDGESLASGGNDRTAVIWDARTGRSRHTLQKHDVSVISVAFSPDGLSLACGTGAASAVLWDVRTGKVERTLR